MFNVGTQLLDQNYSSAPSIPAISGFEIKYYTLYSSSPIKSWRYPSENCPIASFSIELNQKLCGAGEIIFKQLTFEIPAQSYFEFYYDGVIYYSGFVENFVDPKLANGKVKLSGWTQLLENKIITKNYTDELIEDIIEDEIIYLQDNFDNDLCGLLQFDANLIDTGTVETFNNDNSKFRKIKDSIEEIVKQLDDRFFGINADKKIVVYQKNDIATKLFVCNEAKFYKEIAYSFDFSKIKATKLFVFRKTVENSSSEYLGFVGAGEFTSNIMTGAQKLVGVKEDIFTITDDHNFLSTKYIAYWDSVNEDLKFATDESGSWVTSTIDSADRVGQFPAIAIDPNGKSHISYFDITNDKLKYITNKTGSWVGEIIEPDSNTGAYSAITVDKFGNVHIVYLNYVNYDLKYATNMTGGWTIETITSSYNILYTMKIVVDRTGKLHISAFDLDNKNLLYISGNSGSWTIEEIDTAGDVGLYSSLAIGTNDKIYISYFDDTNKSLKFANNVSGFWATQTVDDPVSAQVGGWSSIGLDSDNNVYIAYLDYTNTALKFAMNTSDTWDIYTLDSPFSVGYGCSLVITAQNKICISYLDETNNNLKLASNETGEFVISVIDDSGNMDGGNTSIAARSRTGDILTLAQKKLEADISSNLVESISVKGFDIEKWLPQINTQIKILDRQEEQLYKIINCAALASDDIFLHNPSETPGWSGNADNIDLEDETDIVISDTHIVFTTNSADYATHYIDYDFSAEKNISFVKKIGFWIKTTCDVVLKFQDDDDSILFYRHIKNGYYQFIDFDINDTASTVYFRWSIAEEPADASVSVYFAGIFIFGDYQKIYEGNICQINIKTDKNGHPVCDLKLNNYDAHVNDLWYAYDQKIKKLEELTKQ